MGNGAAIAIGLGAVVVVFLYTKQQEQKTAAMIASMQKQQAAKSSEPYPLSFGDVFAVGGTIVATYFGGPGAGAKAASALAPQ